MAWPFSTVSPSEMVRTQREFSVAVVTTGVCSLSVSWGQKSETDHAGSRAKVLAGLLSFWKSWGKPIALLHKISEAACTLGLWPHPCLKPVA